MKQRITICDHCNLNVNEDGPRAGQVKPFVVSLGEPGDMTEGSYYVDLCAPCVTKLLDMIRMFVSETERRASAPVEAKR